MRRREHLSGRYGLGLVAPALLRGKTELDALRDVRPADESKLLDLQATEPVLEIWGDTALVRHVLLVRFANRVDRIRNTSVWRRDGGRWLCVHNHEDLVNPPSP